MSILTDGEFISYSEATELMNRYRKNYPEALHGFIFSKSLIEKTIGDPTATHLKILLGENEDGTLTPILYASDSDGKRLQPSKSVRDDDDEVLDKAGQIPPGDE
ncbi:MAG: hypothetical protein QM669_04975 [Siphonobacter sp.]